MHVDEPLGTSTGEHMKSGDIDESLYSRQLWVDTRALCGLD